MLLSITIGVLVLSFIGGSFFINRKEIISSICAATFLMSGFTLLVMVVVIACNYFGVPGYIASTKQTYDSLTYQLENDIYDNDNDIGKKELYDDIQEYNETIAKRKVLQDDFWLGVFYPDIYDQFELIEFK